MARRPVIGVMGGGSVSEPVRAMARALGEAIAEEGWILLNGGRAAGVMEASAQGAQDAGGLVIGILPSSGSKTREASPSVDVAIFTGLGDARNAINVLSSDVVIALPGGPGTLSEIALAVKTGRPVILLSQDPGHLAPYIDPSRVHQASSVPEAIEHVRSLLEGRGADARAK